MSRVLPDSRPTQIPAGERTWRSRLEISVSRLKGARRSSRRTGPRCGKRSPLARDSLWIYERDHHACRGNAGEALTQHLDIGRRRGPGRTGVVPGRDHTVGRGRRFTTVAKQPRARAGLGREHHAAADVPRLTDYATSWLRSRLPALKASTAATYADVLDAHVLCHLGDFFLDRLMDSDVREWQDKIAGKFAAATVNGALVVLRMVLADAVAEFRLAHDPTTRIKRMPKRRRPDDDPNVLTAVELGKVMAVFRDTEPEHYPLALTLALTGTRYGEATALRWSDVDEANAVIRIDRAQWHGIVGETKTGNVRTVPLTAELGEVFGTTAELPEAGRGGCFRTRTAG
jgi:hypothetical protein